MSTLSTQLARFRAARLILVAAVLLLAAVTGPVQAAQVNIEFNGLPTGAAPFPTPNYQEGGFTMTSPDLTGSNLVPGIVEAFVTTQNQTNGTSGTLTITATNGSAFEFISLVLTASGGGSGPVSLQVTGYNGANPVGTDTFQPSVNNTPQTFSAVNLADKSIDRLVIVFSNQPTGSGGPLVPQLYSIRLDNAPPGTVVIQKRTAPSPPSATVNFGFQATGLTPNTFTLQDGGSQTFTNVAPGTYGVLEDDPPTGWRLTGLSCDDGASATPSTIDLAAGAAIINLDPGEAVTCTFTNSEDDLIIIEKVTDPPGGTGFDFTGDLGDFSLDDRDLQVSEVTPGTYTITETDPSPDWDLTSIECWVFTADPNDDPTIVNGDTGTRSVELTLTEGQAAFCTFTNTARGNLTVVKRTQSGDGTFEFTSQTLTPNTFNLSTTNGTAQRLFANLTPGIYDVREKPSAWTLVNASCSDGSDPESIDIGPGEKVTCTFVNRRIVAAPAISELGLSIMVLLMSAIQFWYWRRRRPDARNR